MKTLAVVPVVLLATTSIAMAQQATIVVATNYGPRSVEVAAPDHVICSLTNDGRQQAVDVSTASAPLLDGAIFDAPFFDQFCDAAYTPAFGGRLVTTHRFGGINLVDASIPGAMVNLFSSIQPPKYSHEGLEIHTNGSGQTFVAYSEHNVSNTGGGLLLYQMLASSLVPLGSDILIGRDGNALEIGPTGQHIWQLGWISANPSDNQLFVWDTNLWTTPSLVSTVPMPWTTVNYDKCIERAAAPNLLATCGLDGLTAIDISNPIAPVVGTTLAMVNPNLYVDGVTFLDGTDLAIAWGYVDLGGNVYWDFFLFLDASIPGTAVPLMAFPSTMQIVDIKLVASNTRWGYFLGRDRNTLETKLQIW
ncbi:MAG: hypothetical protein HZB39_15140 [Planctomycetes bacterium]|nr:hypothetical protein [Planctomycetota bacterium]